MHLSQLMEIGYHFSSWRMCLESIHCSARPHCETREIFDSSGKDPQEMEWRTSRPFHGTGVMKAFRRNFCYCCSYKHGLRTQTVIWKMYRYKEILNMEVSYIFYFSLYRVIHKSIRDFRPLRYSSRDGHAEGEHVNRGRDTPSLSYITGARYVHPWWRGTCHFCNQVPATHGCDRNLITRLTSAASPRVDISSTCKVGQKFGVSLPLLTCTPSAWLSRLLYRRGRKSQRDVWITLYNTYVIFVGKFHTELHFVRRRKKCKRNGSI